MPDVSHDAPLSCATRSRLCANIVPALLVRRNIIRDDHRPAATLDPFKKKSEGFGVNSFPWKRQGRHSKIYFVNWRCWAVSWPNRAMGVSESSVAWFFPLEKWFQSFKLLTIRPILAHFRCKQQGAVSRGRAVSRSRPPAWSATTADLAQKPPAWSAPSSRLAAFAPNHPLSRFLPPAWSATPYRHRTRT